MNNTKLLSILLRAKEEVLAELCHKILIDKYGKNCVFKQNKDFIYAVGTIPILLVAHLDTVLPNPPEKIFLSEDKNLLIGEEGLGADDRAGVFAILKILQTGRRPSILFTTGEEIGGVGAMEFVKQFAEPLVPTKYVLEIDRRGQGQAVYYDCGNKKFQKYITEMGGFTTYEGIFSDISFICGDWNIAGVNVSAGYVNEHTKDETLNLSDLYWSIEHIITLLDDADNADFFNFEGIPHFDYPLSAKCSICGNTVPYFTTLELEENLRICADCTPKHII